MNESCVQVEYLGGSSFTAIPSGGFLREQSITDYDEDDNDGVVYHYEP